jgi:NADH-quinone oxidoreductase subunit F
VVSCGQCPPCKLGTGDISERLGRIQAGSGTDEDVEEIGSWLGKVTDGARCYLATEERNVVSSILRCFPEEFAEHLETGTCPRPRLIPIAKITEITDGKVVYDEAQARKLPDGTYAASPVVPAGSGS